MMTRLSGGTRSVSFLLAVMLPLAGLYVMGCDEEDQDFLLDTYIVSLDAEPGEVANSVVAIQEDFADIFEFEPLHVFENVEQGFQVRLPWAVVESIEGIEDVGYIVLDNPDEYTPPESSKDPSFDSGETPDSLARIGGPIGGVDFSNIRVAVVDTGIDLSHGDLNVVGGTDIIGGRDGGQDGNGHGTHVAGTIGAISNGDGVIGVAPGVPLVAVRVLDDDGSGTIGDIIAGLEWVAGQDNIVAVNMSLGGASDPTGNQPLRDAIDALEDMGIAVCIAAGNEGADTSGYIPAGYDRGLVVSAYDTDGGDNGFASFSNYGDEVDIAAPGVNVTSTWPGNDYLAISGTSMATPHVTGAVAAYIAAHPSAGPDAAYQAVIDSGEGGYDGQGGDHGEPLLDLTALME
jgi:subtilisin family serine protease